MNNFGFMIFDFRLKHYPSPASGKKLSLGFTLTEVIIVMGLLAVIAAFGVTINFGAYQSYAFQSERNLLVGLLQKARSQSFNNVCLGSNCTGGQAHGVALRPAGQANKYIIFQGPDYSLRDQSQDELFDANSQINVSGLSEIVFAQLSADANASGVIDLTDGIRNQSIEINNEGGILW